MIDTGVLLSKLRSFFLMVIQIDENQIETFSGVEKQRIDSSYVAQAWVGEKVRVCQWESARDKMSLHFST